MDSSWLFGTLDLPQIAVLTFTVVWMALDTLLLLITMRFNGLSSLGDLVASLGAIYFCGLAAGWW